jgi:DNA-directed RNA polymerase specialized sigma24 family protein
MPLLPEGQTEQRSLESMTNGHEADQAFRHLWTLMRERLERAAVRFGLTSEDAEDVVQTVSMNLWERRHTIASQGVGAFWGLAYRAVKNLCIDVERRRQRVPFLPLESIEIPEADRPYVDEVVSAFLQRESIEEIADELWLGICDLDPGELLALRLCLREGVAPHEAERIAGIAPGSIEKITKDLSAVRHALYQSLLWESEALADYVLGCLSSTDATIRLHATVIALRVRHGMTKEEISRRLADEIGEAEVERITESVIEKYPFVAISQRAFGLTQPDLATLLDDLGIWKRLVFEYHLRFELPHRQILERTGPSASVFGIELKPTTLNSWTGNGRLWSQIAAAIAGGSRCL